MCCSEEEKFTINKYGFKAILRDLFRVFIRFFVLLISAGNLFWINAWIFSGLSFSSWLLYMIILYKNHPDLINERGKFIQKSTKKFDKFFYYFYLPLNFSLLIIAGFDTNRFNWSSMPFWSIYLGIFISIFSTVFAFWAASVNTHLEATVRIQKDRNHQVCSSGPYNFVRHPSYVGFIVSILSMPLIFGSWWAFVPSFIIVILIFIRTYLEDKTLLNELPGYVEYSKKTRYRLIPFLWSIF